MLVKMLLVICTSYISVKLASVWHVICALMLRLMLIIAQVA